MPGTAVSVDAPEGFAPATSFSGLQNVGVGASFLVATAPAEAKAQCQRSEASTGQRLCNLCNEDQLGSIEEGRGYKKGCSLFRGAFPCYTG